MSLYAALCLKGTHFSKSIVFVLCHFFEGPLRSTVYFNNCMNGTCLKKLGFREGG